MSLTTRTRHWLPVLILSILALIGIVVVYRYDPAHARFFPPCLFHRLTGLYCPGCGSTRALHQLLHGRPLQAMSLNPLMILCLPFLGFSLLSELVREMRGRPLPTPTLSAQGICGLLSVILLYGVLRNLPFYPFTLLAP
ncbi:MAG: DUF2752 domain-containing protein [bacterium]